VSTLGELLAKQGFTASAAPATPEAAPSARAPADPLARLDGLAKVALQITRKGRGGKTATVLVGLPAEALEAVAVALKKAMGCGAGVEGEVVWVQGDQRERVAAWLTARGVRRVVS
jgi:translation initiation factor 1